jgi:hypothetical protein
LVLRGGESLTTDLIKKLYSRYAVAPDLVEAVCSAIKEYESQENSTQK